MLFENFLRDLLWILIYILLITLVFYLCSLMDMLRLLFAASKPHSKL